MKKHLGLFEGIGGFSLAAHIMGWQTVAWCEINPFCQKILKQHFPHAEGLNDIIKTNFKKYAGTIDIITGGFPCQSFSIAGKGAVDLTLWKEMFRAITEIKPPYVVAENVPGIISRKNAMAFNVVCSDLENLGYEIQPLNIPIAGKGAPHKRERIWFVAYSDSFRCNNEQKEDRRSLQNEKRNGAIEEQSRGKQQCRVSKSNISATELHRQRTFAWSKLSGTFSEKKQWSENWTEVAASLCRVDDGIPNRMDRIKACGNALSPHIALEIFKIINSLDY